MRKVWTNRVVNFLSIFSLVNIFFLPEWANIFGEHSEEQFFLSPSPLENAYFAMGLTVLAVAFLVFSLVLVTQKLKSKKLEAIIYLILLLSWLIPLNFLREFLAVFNYYPWASHVSHRIVNQIILPYKIPLALLGSISILQFVRKYSEKIILGANLIGLIATPILIITYFDLGGVYQENIKYFRTTHSNSIKQTDSRSEEHTSELQSH